MEEGNDAANEASAEAPPSTEPGTEDSNTPDTDQPVAGERPAVRACPDSPTRPGYSANSHRADAPSRQDPTPSTRAARSHRGVAGHEKPTLATSVRWTSAPSFTWRQTQLPTSQPAPRPSFSPAGSPNSGPLEPARHSLLAMKSVEKDKSRQPSAPPKGPPPILKRGLLRGMTRRAFVVRPEGPSPFVASDLLPRPAAAHPASHARSPARRPRNSRPQPRKRPSAKPLEALRTTRQM